MRVFFTLILLILLIPFSYSQTTQTFIASGTFTVPSGVTSIFVEAWGAGGAGGSAVGTGSPTNYRAQAGGGGGGAYVNGTISVTPGDVINYIVAPSTGANTTTTPLNGGESTFVSISAPGGTGGECVNAGTFGGHVGGTGGSGGSGTYNGGAGATRTGYSGCTTTCANTSAGGGGGAGTAGSGSDANSSTNVGGAGGTSGGGGGANGPSSGNAGAGGAVSGGGGAGAWAAASTTFRNGGAGARGQIRITYTPLPITILSFVASKNISTTILNLITASETNNDYFTIERSGDGRSFESIGEIKGAGNSNQELSYEFVDESPLAGINYYRIKQTDFDGAYSYTEIRSVRHQTKNVIVSPNRTDGKLNVTSELDNYDVVIYNTGGQEVQRHMALSGDQSLSIETLQAGVYFVKVMDQTIRILKF